MEEAVVKQGAIYLQLQQTFGKKWKRCWAVLYRASPPCPARLELHEGAERPRRTEPGRLLLRLGDCVRVARAGDDATCPGDTVPFVLDTAQRRFLLAARPAETEEWVRRLCQLAFPMSQEEPAAAKEGTEGEFSMEENSLYSSRDKASLEQCFEVTVRVTPPSQRCRLRGRCILRAAPDALELRQPQSRELLSRWPYRFLRRFGRDKVTFSFEAGRRCESGEGNFEFDTRQGNEIFQAIEAAIELQRGRGEPERGRGEPEIQRDRGGPEIQRDRGGPEFQRGQRGPELQRDRGEPERSRGDPELQRDRGNPDLQRPRGGPERVRGAPGTEAPRPPDPARTPGWAHEELPCGEGKGAKGKAGARPGAGQPPGHSRAADFPYAEPLDSLRRGSAAQRGWPAEGEYAVPFDTIAKSLLARQLGGLGCPQEGLPGRPAAPKAEHIYDEPEGLAALSVYDEPQEVKGEAWRLQAAPEEPPGPACPYNAQRDDYAVPKRRQPFLLQGKQWLGDSDYDNVALKVARSRNLQ